MVEDAEVDEAIDADADTLKKISEWDKVLDRHWGDWLKEKTSLFRLVAGDQYEKDEERALKDNQKIPVVFNRVGPVIDAVTGAEIQGRQQTQYFPRTHGDAVKNEILTSGVEWVRDLTDADGEESDAKRDAFICGLGAVATEMDYEEDEQGRVVMRRLEAGSALPSPCLQANAKDRRYLRHRTHMSLDEFRSLYGEDVEGVFDPSDGSLATHNADPRSAYGGGSDSYERAEDDEVTVDLWQWYEVETVVMSSSQDGLRVVAYSREDFDVLEKAAAEAGRKIEGVTRRRRKYYTATLTGQKWLDRPKEIKQGRFTIEFITGKRDEEKKVWYGLVRPMKDPQKWANAFFSMLLHMVRTNAKGGLLVEDGAIGDMKRFQASYAKSDEITLVPEGVISGGRMKEKTPPQLPAAMVTLMSQSIDAIPGVTGVNPELMGIADRDQPGILEHQRKQAAYGMLATFFESFRRYRKFQGELMLDFMRMLGPETLIRVSGYHDMLQEQAEAQGMQGHNGGPPMNPDKQTYITVQEALGPESIKYDTIVDEAPAGPNQRERTWQMFVEILPVVREGLTPEMWAEALKYSPFPESFSAKMRELLVSAEPDEQEMMMQRLNEMGAQLDLMQRQAGVRKTNAEAEQKEVETVQSIMTPDPNPQVVM